MEAGGWRQVNEKRAPRVLGFRRVSGVVWSTLSWEQRQWKEAGGHGPSSDPLGQWLWRSGFGFWPGCCVVTALSWSGCCLFAYSIPQNKRSFWALGNMLFPNIMDRLF